MSHFSLLEHVADQAEVDAGQVEADSADDRISRREVIHGLGPEQRRLLHSRTRPQQILPPSTQHLRILQLNHKRAKRKYLFI